MKDKTFDCVDFQHKQALRIHSETEKMTREEELEYWKEKERKYAEKDLADSPKTDN